MSEKRGIADWKLRMHRTGILWLLVVAFCVSYVSEMQGMGVVYAVDTVTSGDWEYRVLENGSLSIYKYLGTNANVTIPTTLDGKRVTEIGHRAFMQNQYFENVVVPEGIVYIGVEAFGLCYNLKSVSLPSSLKETGTYVFMSCKSLTDITIPEGLPIINNGFFSTCISLKKITLPNSVVQIGDSAFYKCTGIEELVLPNGVAQIGDSAFEECTNLKKINIPNGVKEISPQTFYRCENLEYVSIPDTVTSIGDSAFRDCYKLRDLKLPSSLTTIGSQVFGDCDTLTGMVVPNGVTAIDTHVFACADNLKYVVIPNSVTTIGECCFVFAPNVVVVASKNSYAIQYAKENDVSYMCIEDMKIATGIKLNKTKVELTVAESATLSATVSPAKATIKEVFWISSDPEVAVVNTKGKVTAVGLGKATIYAVTKDGSNYEAKCSVSVVDKPSVSKVKSFKAKAKKKGFVLTWKKISGASGYKIQVCTKKNFKGAKTYTVSKSKEKLTITKLKSKKKYYIRISAYKTYKDVNGKKKKAYGKYVTINKKTK